MFAEQEAAARKVIEQYIDGTCNSDVAVLKTCFHSGVVMNGCFDGKLLLGTPEPFFQEIAVPIKAKSPLSRLRKHRQRDSQGERVRRQHRLHQLFYLMDIEGRWQITSKTFITE